MDANAISKALTTLRTKLVRQEEAVKTTQAQIAVFENLLTPATKEKK